MTLTKGLFLGVSGYFLSDAEEVKRVHQLDWVGELGSKKLSKVDGVYLSGNKTRDDILSYLIVGKDILFEVAKMYAYMCLAGVYEL